MQENYRKGDWAEAAKDTAFFAVAVTPVVAPNFFFGTLAPYWIGIGAGVVATGIIVEATGIGEWEEVRDFVLQDPRDMPRDYFETVAPVIDKKTDEWSVRSAHWVDRRLMEVQNIPKNILGGLETFSEDLFKNRFVTGPYLPF